MYILTRIMIIQLANRISSFTGNLISFLILPIVCLPTYEVVIKRYLLNRPTVWTQELTLSLFAVYFLIGGAYTLKAQGFVSMDIFYNRFRERGKLITDAIILISILSFCGILIYHGSIWAWASVFKGERSGSFWNPFVWPVRIMIPIGASLVSLQAISNFLESVLNEKTTFVFKTEKELPS